MYFLHKINFPLWGFVSAAGHDHSARRKVLSHETKKMTSTSRKKRGFFGEKAGYGCPLIALINTDYGRPVQLSRRNPASPRHWL
jgi:hypothetical protein